MAHHFSSPVEPLVEKNLFRLRERTSSRIPEFDEVRPRLPIPVLPEDPEWESLYWSAWESFWRCLRPPSSDSRLVAGYILPKADRYIEMGRSALFANLAGYIPGSFNLIEFLDNFYANQHEDGFISREIDSKNGQDVHKPFEPNSTGPMLLAWTEWHHFRLTEDKNRIASVFWPLLSFHRWCRANRTWRNGLYWTTGYASGLINQPRVPGGRFHHNHWAWIDASAQAVIDCTALERMAILLGESHYADEVVAERQRLVSRINAGMWNDETNFYQDIGPDERFSAVKSIAAYWTLLGSQLVPPERISLFVQHLRDTWSFRTENVLPSMSADSEGYNARGGNLWRGAVWPALTYMVLRGLNAVEQSDLAHKLALNHIEMICRVYDDTGSFWENYAPEEPTPGDPSDVDEAGATPAALIPMIIENILGISIDWPLRQVTWRRCLEREQGYGVRNMPLGNDGTLDLIGNADSVSIRTDAPFSLIIVNEKEVIKTAVPAGAFDLSLK